MSLSPYALILRTRHFLYDKGILRSRSGDLPTICIGNITVGGTGKTPHTEMILRLLKDRCRTAVLSRGYKRKSRGFGFVTAEAGAAMFGDEPVQIKRKFPDTVVAVDKYRLRGLSKMADMQARIRPQAVILDDAFQYRKLRPDLSILLIDWNRPIASDRLLPAGRLRDLPSRINAADIVIVTKCPPYTGTEEMRQWAADNRIPEKFAVGHNLFFTEIIHGRPLPVFPQADPRYTYSQRLILFTGIANNTPLKRHLCESYTTLKEFSFPDHHTFTRQDIKAIASAARSNPTALVLTTEKDAQRILDCRFIPEDLKKKLFFTPITVGFTTPGQEEEFTRILVSACPKGN